MLSNYCKNLTVTLQQVLCRAAVVKRFAVHHHSVDCIFSGPMGSMGSF